MPIWSCFQANQKTAPILSNCGCDYFSKLVSSWKRKSPNVSRQHPKKRERQGTLVPKKKLLPKKRAVQNRLHPSPEQKKRKHPKPRSGHHLPSKKPPSPTRLWRNAASVSPKSNTRKKRLSGLTVNRSIGGRTTEKGPATGPASATIPLRIGRATDQHQEGMNVLSVQPAGPRTGGLNSIAVLMAEPVSTRMLMRKGRTKGQRQGGKVSRSTPTESLPTEGMNLKSAQAANRPLRRKSPG